MIYHLIKFEKLSAGILFDPAGHIRVWRGVSIKRKLFGTEEHPNFAP